MNIYFYGDTGPYNSESPSYALAQPGATDYLARLAKAPVEPDLPPHTVEVLLRAGLLACRDGVWHLPFPFYLEQDLPLIDRLVNEPAAELARQIEAQREELYGEMDGLILPFERPRLLYHCLCDRVLDGTAFDWLETSICTAKAQPNGGEYLPIGFENTAGMQRVADQLLCSSHNLAGLGMVWNSFGDGDGTRHCLVRVVRVLAKSPEKIVDFVGAGHEWFLEDLQDGVVRLSHLLRRIWEEPASELTAEEQQGIAFLSSLGYLDAERRLLVPIFSANAQTVLQSVTARIMPLAEAQFRRVLAALRAAEEPLQAMRHGATTEELSNELWHQLFGRVNERLVASGLVSTPPFYKGQGRYLKSVWLD